MVERLYDPMRKRWTICCDKCGWYTANHDVVRQYKWAAL